MSITNHLAKTLVAVVLTQFLGIGAIMAQDALRDSLIQSVQSRHVTAVETILSEHPELASSRYGPEVPVILFAAFAQDESGFIRPEENALVTAISKHLDHPDIFGACVTGNLPRARTLIEAYPSLIDAAAASGWTLLHFAAFSGNVELAQYLIDRGANVNARAWQSSQIVPLLSGLLVRRREVTQFLLKSGADPMVRESGGFSALHEAAALGDTANIRLLAEWGTELNSRRDNGDRPIDLANKRGHAAAVSLLKELGAETE